MPLYGLYHRCSKSFQRKAPQSVFVVTASCHFDLSRPAQPKVWLIVRFIRCMVSFFQLDQFDTEQQP
ncbi:hypothetical protein L596_026933 [Steinernema carpocapsae]|uniref:Uncharacterized protein n=1 Tax=Steinernema carpocapsae TaxID=34508 RepID=A0A4U5M2V7_STECR|nr:hypothetical protein L596_026933 [Steinernema carpocapsae]